MYFNRNLHRVMLSLVCAALVFACLPMVVVAGQTAAMVVGRVDGEPGERVVVPVTLDVNPGIAALVLSVEYDASRLAVDNVGAVSRGYALGRLSFISPNEVTYRQNPFRVVWLGTANDVSTGVVFSIEFVVPNDAPSGLGAVSVSVVGQNANMQDGTVIALSITNGGVNILRDDGEEVVATPSPTPAATPTPQPTPTPEPDTTPTPQVTPTPQPQNTPTPQATPTPTINGSEYEYTDDDLGFTAEYEYIELRVRELLFVPFNRSLDEMPEALVAERIGADGTRELVIPSVYDAAQPAMRLLGYADGVYTVTSNKIEFYDVSPYDWFYRTVTFAAARELFTGVGDNMFAPQDTMTRAMFITVLSRLDGTDESQYDYSPFTDTDISQWYGSAIAWAQQAGIICEGILAGNVAGTFRPNGDITREEMAVIFANYLAIREISINEIDVPTFYDLDQANDWARDAIQAMRARSIISGIGDNLYNPQGYATRAEVAQIFKNLVLAMVGLN